MSQSSIFPGGDIKVYFRREPLTVIIEGSSFFRPREAGSAPTPIISLSQNFSDDFELISTVLERGALPVPKNYKDRELGYRALYAAVQYLTRKRRRGRSKVEVFVSHAHEDKDLAQRLVRAIELGLHVPSDAIRCTSVPGYDFTPGTDFVEALKEELTGASCVVGLCTERQMNFSGVFLSSERRGVWPIRPCSCR